MRKVKFAAALMAGILALSVLAGCGGGRNETSAAETTKTAEEGSTGTPETLKTGAAMRVGSLKGPTSMGLVNLMKDAEKGSTANSYEFRMETQADTLLAAMAGGDLDAALIPANVAAVLYQKTQGQISVLNINTLGVLYIITGNSDIQSIEDLKGRTLYLTGKGTTPDYVIRYLLRESGVDISDVTLEYKSEAAEVAAILKENPDAAGLLPQPFATVACAQNESLKPVLDLTEVWENLQEGKGSRLVTGVTVVRDEFLQENPDSVRSFMEDCRVSAETAQKDVKGTAGLVAEAGIIEKEAVAEKALPYCSIVYIDGTEMKEALSGYLQVLYDQNPQSVGGNMPGDGFYYMAETK